MALVTASWVLPVHGAPIRDGCVAVREGAVIWVGAAAAGGRPEGRRVDLGAGVLLPGLINAHCHLELSHLAELGRRPWSFVSWVGELMRRRDDASREDVRAAVARAVVWLERSGTVAVGDVSNSLKHLDLLAHAQLRAVVFHELLGWQPETARKVLAAAEDREAALNSDLGRRGVRVLLAAHAVHSVSAELFAGIRRRGGPAALHLAESQAESRFVASGDGPWADFLSGLGLGSRFEGHGLSPVRLADRLGLLRAGLLAVHCVQVDEEDCELLARRSVSVVLCPRSNRTLGVGQAPVPQLLAAGVRLCLGSDSLASSPGLGVLDEAALLHATFPDVAPATWIAMATRGGAEALGMGDLGILAPGRRAALAFVPAPKVPDDPEAFVVSGQAAPRHVKLPEAA